MSPLIQSLPMHLAPSRVRTRILYLVSNLHSFLLTHDSTA